MVQNDEDQNDILKSTTETGKRVEKTIKPEDIVIVDLPEYNEIFPRENNEK